VFKRVVCGGLSSTLGVARCGCVLCALWAMSAAVLGGVPCPVGVSISSSTPAHNKRQGWVHPNRHIRILTVPQAGTKTERRACDGYTVYLTLYLSIYIDLFIYLSIYLCLYLSIYLCIHMCIYVYICMHLYVYMPGLGTESGPAGLCSLAGKEGWVGWGPYVLNTYSRIPGRSHNNVNTTFRLGNPVYDRSPYIFKVNVFTKQAK